VHGNNLPADSGDWQSTYISQDDMPGPGSSSAGYAIGGTAGAGNDGWFGADPRAPKITRPVFLPGDNVAGLDAGTGNNGNSFRGGLQGFNDKLTVTDRHAYWDAGSQRTGLTFAPETANPNTYNNPLTEAPLRNLRTVNRRVSYQKGSDASRNADDLTRCYSWLGEQGSGWSPVYGGEPGYYLPYGSRGGVPFPAVSPSSGTRGRSAVWAGPPHGLHSLTYPDGADTLARYRQLPQMRPVRLDRPSNSPQAGQSYSQTVEYQGASRNATVLSGAGRGPVGWAGRG